VVAKAYDAAGNVGQSANVAVTVFNDTTAPTVSISSPANNSTAAKLVVVTASASDDVAVSKVEFYVNGALQATSAAAPYSFSWNTLAITNGAYTLSAKAYDAAGNVGQSANVAVNVFNDTTAPTVSIASPANNSTAGGSVTVSANASDNVAVSRVEFYVNAALQATSTGAPYSFTWNTAAVTNGAYTLSAKAYDAAGNVGQSANVVVNVFNDTTAPTVSITSPIDNSSVTGIVTVSANASDNVAVSKVEFYVNGSLKGTSTGAPYNYSWSTLAAAEGPNTLSARAYDAAGNMGSSASVTVNVLKDRTAPVVSIVVPVDQSTVDGTVAVSASASDDVAVTSVKFYLNGALKATSTSAPYGFNWNTSAIDNGAYTLTAKAYDAAGNIGQSAGVTVNVSHDTTAPTVAIVAPVPGSTVGGVVTLSATANDNVAVSKVEIYVNGALKATVASAPYNFNWNTKAIANGTYIINAKAYDAAHNFSQSADVAVNVFNDITPPVVVILSPATSSVSGTSVSLSASATDDVAVTRMELYIDDSLIFTTSESSFRIDWNLTIGSHKMTVKAYDAANNVKSVSKTVKRTL
jgi:hypothetical protein